MNFRRLGAVMGPDLIAIPHDFSALPFHTTEPGIGLVAATEGVKITVVVDGRAPVNLQRCSSPGFLDRPAIGIDPQQNRADPVVLIFLSVKDHGLARSNRRRAIAGANLLLPNHWWPLARPLFEQPGFGGNPIACRPKKLRPIRSASRLTKKGQQANQQIGATSCAEPHRPYERAVISAMRWVGWGLPGRKCSECSRRNDRSSGWRPSSASAS